MNLFYQPRLKEGVLSLDGDEAKHLRVLRLHAGDEISVTDGKGLLVKAALKDDGFVTLEKQTSERSSNVYLFVAPTKNADRMEWLVEKATEIGVASITMVRCERSERKNINHDRLIKMAVSAMKQSQQSWLPEIPPLTPFEDIIKKKFDQNLIAYVDHTNPDHLKKLARPGSIGLLIGPEGDFTNDELTLAAASQWKKVSLGPTRLRTETAALAALVLLNNLEP